MAIRSVRHNLMHNYHDQQFCFSVSYYGTFHVLLLLRVPLTLDYDYVRYIDHTGCTYATLHSPVNGTAASIHDCSRRNHHRRTSPQQPPVLPQLRALCCHQKFPPKCLSYSQFVVLSRTRMSLLTGCQTAHALSNTTDSRAKAAYQITFADLANAFA